MTSTLPWFIEIKLRVYATLNSNETHRILTLFLIGHKDLALEQRHYYGHRGIDSKQKLLIDSCLIQEGQQSYIALLKIQPIMFIFQQLSLFL